MPLNVIGSLDAPAPPWEEDEEIRDEIEGTVSSLLGLVGIDADPLGSREHVLLANLLEHNQRGGKNLDLGTLISQVQTPPLRKLGVFDVDAFMPAKERTELAMRLNALVASPSFAAWGRGPALDPRLLLRTEDGRPRAAVVYLAHLSDEERQLVVTLVLSRLITWMHEQPGDLRAIVYLDEVYGFAPDRGAAVEEAILTLLKRARAFGIGMSSRRRTPSTSTTRRWRTRAAGSSAASRPRTTRSGCSKGCAPPPAASTSTSSTRRSAASSSGSSCSRARTAASRSLLDPLGNVVPARAADEGADREPDAGRSEGSDVGRHRGVRCPCRSHGRTDARRGRERGRAGGRAGYLRPLPRPGRALAASIGAAADGKRLQAFLAARVSLRYDDTKAGLDTTQEWEALYGPLDAGLDLDDETAVDYDDRDFRTEPLDGASYVLSSAPIDKESFFRDAARSIQRRVTDQQTLELFRVRGLNVYSRPGETREQFEARADEAAQAAADAETAKIRDRLETKRDRLDRALETARRKVEEAGTEQSSRRSTELLSGVGSDRRPARRQGEHAHDRPRRAGARERREPARDDEPRGRAKAHRRGAGRDGRGRPRSARAGAARRGGRDRRQVEGEGGRGRDGRDPAREHRRARRRDDAPLGAERLSRAFAVAAVAALAGCGGDAETPVAPPAPGAPATVAFVADGDTIELGDGRRVRLLQVDAPELFGECYGPAAHVALRHLLPAGSRVRLARDSALDDRDRYGRLLRYVTAGATNVNVELVRRGAAAPYFFGSRSGRHADALLAAAESAVAAAAACGARARRRAWSQAARS